jgi:nucleoside-diphosphate-sugar epimerase
MSSSFTISGDIPLAESRVKQRRVLVTGAAGNIGSYFAEHAHQKYALRLLVLESDDPSNIQSFGEVVTGDIRDLARMREVCQDIDTVVHLAADPDPSALWSNLLPLNIEGTYNTLVAAKAAGCRRVLFASSIHAVSKSYVMNGIDGLQRDGRIFPKPMGRHGRSAFQAGATSYCKK